MKDSNQSDLIQAALNSISDLEGTQLEATMIIAAHIDDALKLKGWNKEKFVQSLQDKDRSRVTLWLSGVHNFTVHEIVEIESVLGIDILIKD